VRSGGRDLLVELKNPHTSTLSFFSSLLRVLGYSCLFHEEDGV
jgi:hypothetical protein